MDSKNLTEKKEQPTFKVKVANIDLAVWSNENDSGNQYFSVSYNKNYLDKNKEWQKTNHLLVNDIPNLQVALQKAYEGIKVKN
ncbi:MAG: hypothetical protein ACOC16_02190 [Nanoarchaeota archaeon]